MRKHSFQVWVWLLCAAGVFMLLVGSALAQQTLNDRQANGDKPTADKPAAKKLVPGKKPTGASRNEKAKSRAGRGGAGPADPPAYFRKAETGINAPSVIEGQAGGIEVGDFAPDFELEPIQPYAYLQKWLGDDAPESMEKNITLSDLVGEAPVMLLFGSYT